MESVQRLMDELGVGGVHSGEVLGDRLEMTRAGIWKLVARANEDYGAGISRHGRRGYSLSFRPEWLDANRISGLLAGEGRPSSIATVQSTGSTNDDLLKKSALVAAPAVALFAEHQGAGRGRRGRSWVSGLGRSVCGSLAFTLRDGAKALEGFSLAVGVELVERLELAGVKGLQLKWPNDIVRAGAKVGGILIEIVGDPMAECLVVVGVGLNFHLPAGRLDPGYRVGSIVEVSSHVNRNQVAAVVIDSVLAVIQSYPGRGFEAIQNRWSRFDSLVGHEVVLKGFDGASFGRCRGVSPRGALLVEQEGMVREVFSGEVSVRLS